MTSCAKVVTCLHRFVHFNHVRMTRRRGVSPPENGPPSYGLELLEPRLMLSGTGLLPAAELSGDAPSVATVAITVGDPSSEVSAEHLVMHLQFDESAGTVATDTSPHGIENDGSLTNGASFAADDGPLGGAVVLDGADDYVSVDNSSDLNLDAHARRTIGIWFNIDDTAVSSQKQVVYEEGGRIRGLNIYVHDGLLHVGGWNYSQSEWSGTYLATNAVEAGTWHHVVLVLDAEEDSETLQPSAFTAYLDGVEYDRGSGSQVWEHVGGIGIGAVNGRTQFHDGSSDQSDRHAFAGKIADVRVYNRVLAASEIAVLASDRTSSDLVELKLENRSIDGTGNNLAEPTQGAAETNLIRFGYPAVFPDGHGDMIEDVDQPNARDVSNLINDQDELNGIAFQGVGSATKVEHLMVRHN